jgi:replication fork clamp-binding protein CrfC
MTTLIAAIIPANDDVANSEALRLAERVDPKHERTIGILTKIDIMDEGTNVNDILHGHSKRLDHGYVPVVMRSQKDIETGMSLLE